MEYNNKVPIDDFSFFVSTIIKNLHKSTKKNNHQNKWKQITEDSSPIAGILN